MPRSLLAAVLLLPLACHLAGCGDVLGNYNSAQEQAEPLAHALPDSVPPSSGAGLAIPFPADVQPNAVEPVSRQAAATEITDREGIQTWQRGGTTSELGSELLLDPAAGETAWGMYQFSGMADGDRITSITIEVPAPGPDNYFLGWADYNSNSWIWQQRGDKTASTSVDDVFEPPAGINPISLHGNVQVVVVAYDAAPVRIYSVALTAELYEVPVAIVFADPSIGNQDLTVEFDASLSYVRGGGSISEYEWDWDGAANGWSFESSGSDSTAQHVFSDPGQYQTVLRVTGPSSNLDLGKASVTISGWQQSWGNTGAEICYSVSRDESGCIYLAGYESGTGNGQDALLIKYDRNHAFCWARSLGDASSNRDIYEDVTASDGRIYAAGYTASYGVEWDDLLLACYKADGSLQWIRTWGSFEFDTGRALAVSTDGYLYVAGHTRSYGNEAELLLLKFDLDGNLVWAKTWGGPNNEFTNDLVLYNNSDIYVCGESASFGGGDADALLIKFNADGERQWARTWGGSLWEGIYGLAMSAAGDIYCTGGSASFTTGTPPDMLVMKFNDAGDFNWIRTVTYEQPDIGECVVVSSTLPGILYIIGRSNFNNKDYPQCWQVSTSGSLQWSRHWLPAADDSQAFYSGDVGSGGTLLLAGFAASAHGSWIENIDYWTVVQSDPATPVLNETSDATGILGTPAQYKDNLLEGTEDTGGGSADAMLLEFYPANW